MAAPIPSKLAVQRTPPQGSEGRVGKKGKPTIVKNPKTETTEVKDAPKATEAKIDSDSLSAALFELFPNAPAALLDMIAMDAGLGDADTPEALAEMLEGDVLDSLPGETPKAQQNFALKLAKKAFEKKAEKKYDALPKQQQPLPPAQ